MLDPDTLFLHACNGGLIRFHPALLHSQQYRHYVLHLGRLDLKVMTPDGLIT